MANVKAPGWGGPRKGSGRPPSTEEGARNNRVVVTLTDGQLAKLRAIAKARDLPLGTAAYQILERGLRRAT